ncbi:hypothetical protein Tco_0191000 [Tanacetum coccineum]
MKLLMAKCLNSTEYIEALGNAFGRAIEKGMQEGLAAGIEHGQAEDVMSLRNDDLQPDVGQLMVPVHHKQDKVVIGSQALSVALETFHSIVRKMERNLAERLPFLKDVFLSIDHPVSAEALAILPETSTEPPDYENPDLAGAVPEDVILEPEGKGKVGGSTEGDVDAGDLMFSQLENEARDVVL